MSLPSVSLPLPIYTYKVYRSLAQSQECYCRMLPEMADDIRNNTCRLSRL